MKPKEQKQESAQKPTDQLTQCAIAVQQALAEHKCQMYTALKVGNMEIPLGEVEGCPIVIKLGALNEN